MVNQDQWSLKHVDRLSVRKARMATFDKYYPLLCKGECTFDDVPDEALRDCWHHLVSENIGIARSFRERDEAIFRAEIERRSADKEHRESIANAQAAARSAQNATYAAWVAALATVGQILIQLIQLARGR